MGHANEVILQMPSSGQPFLSRWHSANIQWFRVDAQMIAVRPLLAMRDMQIAIVTEWFRGATRVIQYEGAFAIRSNERR
jgi:hypothetical protein